MSKSNYDNTHIDIKSIGTRNNGDIWIDTATKGILWDSIGTPMPAFTLMPAFPPATSLDNEKGKIVIKFKDTGHIYLESHSPKTFDSIMDALNYADTIKEETIVDIL